MKDVRRVVNEEAAGIDEEKKGGPGHALGLAGQYDAQKIRMQVGSFGVLKHWAGSVTLYDDPVPATECIIIALPDHDHDHDHHYKNSRLYGYCHKLMQQGGLQRIIVLYIFHFDTFNCSIDCQSNDEWGRAPPGPAPLICSVTPCGRQIHYLIRVVFNVLFYGLV